MTIAAVGVVGGPQVLPKQYNVSALWGLSPGYRNNPFVGQWGTLIRLLVSTLLILYTVHHYNLLSCAEHEPQLPGF